ncbi:hypothetical protein ON010_g17495 [Phytophthora cinnamomi]|nr:hypothetical protein ON010_g17495 [Phytophthora cinnamomi]
MIAVIYGIDANHSLLHSTIRTSPRKSPSQNPRTNMRSTNIAFLLGSMILLLAGCALSEPTKYGQGGTGTMAALDAAQNSRVRGETSLRSLRETTNMMDEELGGEERGLSLSWLKKLTPWKPKDVNSLNKKLQAQQLRNFRKVEANKEKALKAATELATRRAKYSKEVKIFEELLASKAEQSKWIAHWSDNKVSVRTVRNLMKKAGVYNADYEAILTAYKKSLKDKKDYLALRDIVIPISFS